jgi:hypothetical protein
MGVRERRIVSSGPTEPKGSNGRVRDPSCVVPLAVSSEEESAAIVEGALEFDGPEAATVAEVGCRRRETMFRRRDRTTDVRSFRGSMTSADSRSKKSDWRMIGVDEWDLWGW